MKNLALPSPERLQELWSFENSYGSLSPAQALVPAGDRLLGVSGSTLFALDIFHGKEPAPDAQVEVPGFPYTFKAFYGGDPYVTAAGGVVYFMDGDELVALRLSDGLPLRKRDKTGKWVAWESPILRQVSALLAIDDKVVAIHIGDSGATEATAFLAVNGERAFGPVVISDLSPGRVAYGEGAVFFVADGTLHAVNVDFGDARFARTKGGVASEPMSLSAAPCVARDVVVAAGTKLHFFDVKTGARMFEPIAASKPGADWKTPILADKGKLIIACNPGEVVAVRTRDGKVAWRNAELTGIGEPTLNRGQVLVTTDNRSMLAVLSVTTGQVERRMRLPEIAAAVAPVVTNETVFIPHATGSIEARSFAKQHAAYFDGRTSCIDIEADEDHFDFGTNDFTIESWIRSSEGGEIVSSHPTAANSESFGIRVNLGQNGELRVAIADADEKRVSAGRTRPTRANDGEWHHVALIRRDGRLLVLLDGKSHDVFFRKDSEAGLSIGGRSALTIGAHRSARGKDASSHFQGLIREVRIWDRALDVATVQNNRHVQLTGTEPRLKGLWSLAEVHGAGKKTEPRNAVEHHAARTTFLNAASAPTDLSLDRSGFPYLLHELESHWPYAGTWAARGEHAIAGSVAIGDSAVAFATNNALYGVRRSDGRRLWQMDVSRGASAPVADGSRFLLLTGDDGLITVDATTGESTRMVAFAGLMKEPAALLAAPAVSATHIAAGAPHGAVMLVARNTNNAGREITVPAPVRELAFGDERLFVLSGADTATQIASIELSTGNATMLPVTNCAFTTDHEWLFCVRGGRLTRLAPSQLAKPQLQVSAPANATITGMAARCDDDLLVVTTDQGSVHGFSMADLTQRWTTTLPEGRKRGSNSVSTPAFDAAGRVYCTTKSGVVAVLDSATGARVGLYSGSESVVTPPALAAATVYYGCSEPENPKAYRDGALHSVVFGETMVLRLGLDERGSPSRAKPYGLVDIETLDVDKHVLHHMDPTRNCIETWINIPRSYANSARRPGGGVLGICPTLAGGFDLNLSVDEDGTLHYSSRSLQNGTWRMLRADAATSLSDGRWHHVAIARQRAEHVVIYVDGRALPNVEIVQSDDAPRKTVKGMKAFLGATAGDELEAVRPFCGMIAEVRVWDTYLEPAEVSARMHVKLRGNEPDLLAYWNFDLENIEDAGPEHHHGTLTALGADPVWWLSDLAFDKPSYPFITTTGKILEREPGQPTVYQVAFTVHRADGTGLPGHALDLWYVRRREADPTDALFDGTAITGVRAADEPEPGAPSPDGKARVFSAVTGNDGTVTVLIASTREGHAPAIDLRAAFMARNGRFHVNVLLDDQALVAPAPPTLVVQSKLIQDYSYSSGGTINEDRDRSTWRTVIRAVNPNGTVRTAEPISLWGGAQMKVDVAGRSYAVNKENSAELVTDGQGEVIVVFDAEALTAPTLMARAGFMHRNDRIVIAPDQELHRKLSSVSGAQLTEKRTTRWKPGMDDGEGEGLMAGDYAPHAEKVAGAIVTVMAGAKPADAEPAPTPRGGAQLLRSKAQAKSGRRLLRAEEQSPDPEPMRQPNLAVGSDRVVTVRTMGHAPLRAPVNPDGVRTALADNSGFVFETIKDKRGRPTVRFEMLETVEDVDGERGRATREPVMLRGFFDDLWSGIKDVATDIYDGVTKIVVSVVDAIEVAIHTMVDGITKIVHVVVDSIVEAVNAVAGFFEQLGVLIMKAIEFLRALFNWKAILRTKVIIHDLFILTIDDAKKALMPARIDTMFRPLIGGGALKRPPEGQSISATSTAGGEPTSPAVEESRGVQGQMVIQKSRESGGATSNAEAGADAGSDTFSDLLRRLPNAVSGIIDSSPAEMLDKLFAMLKAGIDASVELFIAELKAISSVVVELVDWVMKLVRTEIDIPFVSELYYWITGTRLTLLDLLSLAVAVPVHVAHIAVTTMMGHTSTFADDNQDLVARVRAAQNGTPMPPRTVRAFAPHAAMPADDVPPARKAKIQKLEPMDVRYEPLIIVARVINMASGVASDVMFTKTIAAGGIGAASQADAKLRGLAKLLKGLTGILATGLTVYVSTPAFERRLEDAVSHETWDKIKPMEGLNHAQFGMLTAGDLITLSGGVVQMLRPSLPQTAPISESKIDNAEFVVACSAAWGCIAAIAFRIKIMNDRVDHLEEAKLHLKDPRNFEDLIMQVKLFGARDISTVIARMPWGMFTQTGANQMIRFSPSGAKTFYSVVTGVRAVGQAIALGTHVVSVYGYGLSRDPLVLV